MIELLFSDSASYALRCAKSQGDGQCIGGVSVMLTIDENGNETRESFDPEPYTGPTIDGSPDDIAGIWLTADVGDISNLSDWERRIDGIQKLLEVYEDDQDEDEDWTERAAEQATALVGRLKNAAKTGEPVRVWWSDAPGEACGYCWAMAILQDAVGPVTSIKIPEHITSKDCSIHLRSTGDLTPELFSRLLSLEQAVLPAERKSRAAQWQKLVEENAPLRAMVGGDPCSVSVDFYDHVLHEMIPSTPCRVEQIIGHALTKGPNGVSDWWYANRLRTMISDGQATLIEHKKPFYGSLVSKKI